MAYEVLFCYPSPFIEMIVSLLLLRISWFFCCLVISRRLNVQPLFEILNANWLICEAFLSFSLFSTWYNTHRGFDCVHHKSKQMARYGIERIKFCEKARALKNSALLTRLSPCGYIIIQVAHQREAGQRKPQTPCIRRYIFIFLKHAAVMFVYLLCMLRLASITTRQHNILSLKWNWLCSCCCCVAEISENNCNQ